MKERGARGGWVRERGEERGREERGKREGKGDRWGEERERGAYLDIIYLL